jgi:HNH endonuclease
MVRRRRTRTTAPSSRNGHGARLGRRERLDLVLDRDGARCVWCGRTFDDVLVTPTTEHVVPRVKGGPSWIENEVAACHRCNSERGHRTPAEYVVVCRDAGRAPDLAAVVSSLRRLAAAIEAFGGQRRARPYVASQLRRLERMLEVGGADRARRP